MNARTGVVMAAVAVLATAQAGCIVHVTRVSDAGTAFERAREEALRFAGRPGPASELNVLAFDPSERKMVRVSVPLWLIRSAEGHIDWDDIDPDDEHRRWRRNRKLGKLRWEDIERSAPGILLEVLEDEGDRVLIWLR
jgi:hypothetical protein